MKDAWLMIRIDAGLKARFTELCERDGETASGLVRKWIADWVREREAKEVETVDYLQELTGQESGIVVYGREGLLVNWAGIKGLPRVFVTGIVGLGEPIRKVKGEHRTDIRDILDGVDIAVYADFEDEELPEAGTVYRISDDVMVIAPDGWN